MRCSRSGRSGVSGGAERDRARSGKSGVFGGAERDRARSGRLGVTGRAERDKARLRRSGVSDGSGERQGEVGEVGRYRRRKIKIFVKKILNLRKKY